MLYGTWKLTRILKSRMTVLFTCTQVSTFCVFFTDTKKFRIRIIICSKSTTRWARRASYGSMYPCSHMNQSPHWLVMALVLVLALDHQHHSLPMLDNPWIQGRKTVPMAEHTGTVAMHSQQHPSGSPTNNRYQWCTSSESPALSNSQSPESTPLEILLIQPEIAIQLGWMHSFRHSEEHTHSPTNPSTCTWSLSRPPVVDHMCTGNTDLSESYSQYHLVV